jgi:hypothetical protein
MVVAGSVSRTVAPMGRSASTADANATPRVAPAGAAMPTGSANWAEVTPSVAGPGRSVRPALEDGSASSTLGSAPLLAVATVPVGDALATWAGTRREESAPRSRGARPTARCARPTVRRAGCPTARPAKSIWHVRRRADESGRAGVAPVHRRTRGPTRVRARGELTCQCPRCRQLGEGRIHGRSTL